MKRKTILIDREKTHGDFADNAMVSQRIKSVIREAYISSPVFRESLDMIALKIGRICSGQHDFRDHWEDIAGYAELAAEMCGKRKNG